MTDRSEEMARRTADARFRVGRNAVSSALQRLLGDVAARPIEDRDRAAALTAEFWSSLRAAEPHDWEFIVHEWPTDDREAVSALLHRFSAHLGSRPVWLTLGAREPQAVAIASDSTLDNPIGFAALSDNELRLLDRDTAAGLWLGQHSHHGSSSTSFTWELNVWGEPWVTAAHATFRDAAG